MELINKEIEKYGAIPCVFRMKPLERFGYEFWKRLFFLESKIFWGKLIIHQAPYFKRHGMLIKADLWE